MRVDGDGGGAAAPEQSVPRVAGIPRAVVGTWLMVVAAVVSVGFALPSAYVFLRQGAPGEFWAMAALALLVDLPLFMDQRDNVRVRSTLSVCVCIAIFLLWGPGPAVVVQALAGIVTSIGQRYLVLGSMFLVSRLVVALTVAGVVRGLDGPIPMLSVGGSLNGWELFHSLRSVGVFIAAAYGVSLLMGLGVSIKLLRHIARQMRDDFFITVASILLVTPLLIMVPSWWNAIVAVPLAAWGLALGDRIRHDRRMRRDPVTGLQNLHGLRAHVGALTMTDVIRVRPFAVMMFNSNSLPDIRRSLGRDVYDAIVCEAARRLRQVCGSDRVGRLPGEGLVIIGRRAVGPRGAPPPGARLVPLWALGERSELGTRVEPGVRKASGACGVGSDPVKAAQQVVDLLTRPGEVKGIPFKLDAVVGVALSPEHGRDLDTLLVKAHLAMTEAMRRNQSVLVYDAASAAAAARRVDVLTELRDALADPGRHREISLHYQPQVEIERGRLVGAEALVRWTHPRWGLVPPDELIDAIETSEVMHLLTRRVLETAAAQVREWNERDFRIRVSVNASGQDLYNPGLIEDLKCVLRVSGIPASQVNVEITEKTVLLGGERLLRTVYEITDLGVGLSVDDFGTGYASMHQLRILPATEVKLDRTYVDALTRSHVQRSIVASLQQLSRALGLRMVVEGVEDRETADVLARMPGTVGQGYYFGPPVPAGALYQQWHRPRPSMKAGAPS